MKAIFVLTVTAIVCINSLSVSEVNTEWESFKLKHGKQYASESEEALRQTVFKDTLERITAHNEKYEKGLVSYKLKVNKFADLTPDEFRQRYTGYKKGSVKPEPRDGELLDNIAVEQFEPKSSDNIPDAINWKELGAVTEVKDQDTCGGCWSFSTTGALEGQLFRKTGKLISMSEQNLIDCSTEAYENYGCQGGNMFGGFAYVILNGIDSEENYPYQGTNGTCHYTAKEKVTSASSIMSIESENEDALTHAVATLGPVSVAIDVEDDLSFYDSGIYDSTMCSSLAEDLNHGLLVVGYGSENGKDYWILKNSWGSDWGENGYGRMARNKNMCGITIDTSVPVL